MDLLDQRLSDGIGMHVAFLDAAFAASDASGGYGW